MLPYLVAKRDQSFPDPSKFTHEEEFTYAAKVTSVFKKVIEELLAQIETWKQAADFYEKKEKGEIKKFDI